jgi:hypothetical protein
MELLVIGGVPGLQWGTVGEWVSGLATVVAVVVALTFALRSELEQRNTQLAAVYAWVEVAQDAKRTATLWLTNNTDYPIYDWRIEVSWTDEDEAQRQAETGSTEHGLLPPGRHSFAFTGVSLALPSNDTKVRVRLDFRDARGRRLRRLSSGKLEKL